MNKDDKNKMQLSDIEVLQIMNKYKELVSVLELCMTAEELAEIDEAFHLAFRAHASERRQSGEPYIMHPLNVAMIISKELGLGSIAVICALLHDVVEDTDVSLELLQSKLGSVISGIVAGLTKINKSSLWEPSTQADNFQKLLGHITHDSRVILVKLADRLDNMRTIDFLPRYKQLRIASESKYIYVPIAHRLGLSKLKMELEDLYLKVVNPDAYYTIAKKLRSKREDRENNIKDFIAPIEEELRRQDIKFRIKTRIKSIYSIYKKIHEKKIPFNQVYDLIAVRIILPYDVDQEKIVCWQTYGVVTKLYTPNHNRTRDWISIPRSNGYESLHVTVMSKTGQWVEVQIRSTRMHEVASKGIAAHWKYKEEPTRLIQGIDKWVEEVGKLANESKNSSLKILQNLQKGFYNEEVFVFTESGDLVSLPKGATVLDFAIEVMGKRGFYVEYGYINESVVPLNHVLEDGDQVKMKTKLTQLPKEEWEDFVVTSKATRILEKFFRELKKSKKEKGLEVLRKEFSEHGLELSSKEIEQFRGFLGAETLEEVYYRLGSNKISRAEIDSFIKFVKKSQMDDEKSFEELILSKKKKFRINRENVDEYEIASCCTPVPREEVFGVVTPEKVIIHRLECLHSNLLLSSEASRIIEPMWDGAFPVKTNVHLKAINKKGSTKGILNAVNAWDIESIIFHRDESKEITGGIRIEIRDIKELNQIMDKLANVSGVISVSRV